MIEFLKYGETYLFALWLRYTFAEIWMWTIKSVLKLSIRLSNYNLLIRHAKLRHFGVLKMPSQFTKIYYVIGNNNRGILRFIRDSSPTFTRLRRSPCTSLRVLHHRRTRTPYASQTDRLVSWSSGFLCTGHGPTAARWLSLTRPGNAVYENSPYPIRTRDTWSTGVVTPCWAAGAASTPGSRAIR